MASQAATTSSSRFFASMFIDDLPRGFDLLTKDWIANGALGEEIDLTLEQMFERNGKVQVAIGIGARGFIGKADYEIQIAAGRIEVFAGGRAKDFQPLDAKAQAKPDQFLRVLLEKRNHKGISKARVAT